MLEFEDNKNVIILHHSNIEKDETKYGFIIVGGSFKERPSKEEIESCGILGDKYQNDSADLINSAMRSQQKYDSTTFYTGVKYDMLTIPKSLFDREKTRIVKVANFNCR